jgi:hypothetical protein
VGRTASPVEYPAGSLTDGNTAALSVLAQGKPGDRTQVARRAAADTAA